MAVVTANDLKTRGVSDIEAALENTKEVVISVRGVPKYVVMDIAHYDYLRECEIKAVWAQAREERAAGRYRRETADEHLARLADEDGHAL